MLEIEDDGIPPTSKVRNPEMDVMFKQLWTLISYIRCATVHPKCVAFTMTTEIHEVNI